MTAGAEGDGHNNRPAGEKPKPSFEEQYRIEEFKSVKIEMERHLTDQRATERYIMLADAAIYAAILFRKDASEPIDSTALALAWWLPPIIGLLGLARGRENIQMVAHAARYIRGREPSGIGWENYLLDLRRKKKLTTASVWYVLFWGMAIGGTTALAFYKNVSGLSSPGYTAICVGLLLAVIAGAAVMLPRRGIFIDNDSI